MSYAVRKSIKESKWWLVLIFVALALNLLSFFTVEKSYAEGAEFTETGSGLWNFSLAIILTIFSFHWVFRWMGLWSVKNWPVYALLFKAAFCFVFYGLVW